MEISTHYQVPPQNLCRLANIELYCPTLAFQSSPSLQNFQLLQLLSPPLSFLVCFERQAQIYFLSLTFPSTAFRENLLSLHLCVSGVEGGHLLYQLCVSYWLLKLWEQWGLFI